MILPLRQKAAKEIKRGSAEHALLALGSVFAFASSFSEGNAKQVGQLFRHRNHVMSDFRPSEMRRMFLLKTPSQYICNSLSIRLFDTFDVPPRLVFAL
jgi:hypothetical protein